MDLTQLVPTYFLYKVFGNFRFINWTIRKSYLHILIPVVVFYLKYRHENIVLIEKRHSLLEGNNFNGFLSDIDLSIVIKNNSDYVSVLKTFFLIKNFFIMLDSPEIYYQYEFDQVEKIKNSEQWNILYSLWSIRKINWSYISIKNNPTEFNVLKQSRSIQVSLSKILINDLKQTKSFELSDFKFLNNLISVSAGADNKHQLCYYSWFLETTTPTSIQLLLNSDEIEYFNSLMPGELHLSYDLELKKMITLYEILITKTSMRIDAVNSIENQKKQAWLDLLENQFC